MEDEQEIASVGRTLLDLLLNSNKLWDRVSFEKFQTFFPPKYRDEREVRELYSLFLEHREQVREEIKNKVHAYYPGSEKEEVVDLEDPIEAEDLDFLRRREKELQEELTMLEEENEKLTKYFADFEREIDTIHVISDVRPQDITLPQIKDLIKFFSEVVK